MVVVEPPFIEVYPLVVVVSPVIEPPPIVVEAPPFMFYEAAPLDPAPFQDEFHSFSARVEPLAPYDRERSRVALP